MHRKWTNTGKYAFPMIKRDQAVARARQVRRLASIPHTVVLDARRYFLQSVVVISPCRKIENPVTTPSITILVSHKM